MARLINADVLLKKLDKRHFMDGIGMKIDVVNSPAIDHVKQEWISVEEKLPADEQKVLCCGCKGNIFVASDLCGQRFVFRKGSWRIWADKSNRYKRFSHWMPLPDPPEVIE